MRTRTITLTAIALILLVPFASASLVLTKLNNPATLPPNVVRAVAWTPDESYVAFGGQGTSPFLTVYNASSGNLVKIADPATVPNGTVFALAWGPDSRTLVLATGASPFMRAYYRTGDTLTLISDANWNQTTPSAGLGVEFSPDGTKLVAASATSPFVHGWTVSGSGAGTTFTRWNTFPLSPALGGAGGDVVRWTHDGSRIVLAGDSGGTNGRTAVFNATTNWATTTCQVTTDQGSQSTDAAWDNTNTVLSVANGQSTGEHTYFYNSSASTCGTLTALTMPAAAVGNIDGTDWDSTGTYVAYCGTSTPFIETYTRSGSGASSTFIKNSAPASLPNGSCGIQVRWSPFSTYLSMSLIPTPFENTYTTNASVAPPAAPILTATVVTLPLPARCSLVWTTPSSGLPIQGYNVTETSDYGSLQFYNLSVVNTLSAFVHTRTYNYTVHAWTSSGNGPESNIAGCVQTASLSGATGFLYGGDRAGQANSFGISTTAIDMWWAILITLFGVMVGYLSLARIEYGNVGAAVGGIIALVFEFALNLVPTWAILFELVVVAALAFTANKIKERRA